MSEMINGIPIEVYRKSIFEIIEKWYQDESPVARGKFIQELENFMYELAPNSIVDRHLKLKKILGLK